MLQPAASADPLGETDNGTRLRGARVVGAGFQVLSAGGWFGLRWVLFVWVRLIPAGGAQLHRHVFSAS